MLFRHWHIRPSARPFWYLVPRLGAFVLLFAMLWAVLLLGPHA